MQRIRWPRTLSVFAGSDSDSDSAQSSTTALGSTTNAKRSLSPGRPVHGVYLFCSGDQFQPALGAALGATNPSMALATVPQSDGIFQTTPLAISTLIGIPLQMRRLQAKPALSLPKAAHYDNQLATHLQIDPDTGSAPAEWSQGVGTVLVVREDQQPLSKDLLSDIIKFHSSLLGLHAQRRDIDIKTWVTPQRFADSTQPARGATPGPTGASQGQPQSQRVLRSQALSESWLDVGKQVSV